MALLDLLEKDYLEKDAEARAVLVNYNNQLQQLIVSSVNIPGVKISCRCDISEWELTDRSYSYNSVRVDLEREVVDGKDRDHFSFDVYIHKDFVEVNNCCCGSWRNGSLYHEMLKAILQVMEIEAKLVEFEHNIDRSAFKLAREAEREFDKERGRIQYEEEKAIKTEIEASLQVGDLYSLGGKLDESVYEVSKITDKTITMKEYRASYNYGEQPEGRPDYSHRFNRNTRETKDDVISKIFSGRFVKITPEQAYII